jgi:hypothetical protein
MSSILHLQAGYRSSSETCRFSSDSSRDSSSSSSSSRVNEKGSQRSTSTGRADQQQQQQQQQQFFVSHIACSTHDTRCSCHPLTAYPARCIAAAGD